MEKWTDLSPALGLAPGVPKREAWRRASAASPERLAALIRERLGPSDRALSLLDERVVAAWRLIPKAERPQLMALAPNVRGMIREATERGMIGAGLGRVRRLGLVQCVRLGFAHLTDAPGVLRRDFPTLLRILNDVERSEAAGLRADAIILQPQMTDLALAMGNSAILRDFLARTERAGRLAGLATNNPSVLAERLAEASDDLPPPRGGRERFVVPMNPRRDAPGVELPTGWRRVALEPILAPAATAMAGSD